MLQKLKLMFNLEVIAIQRKVSVTESTSAAASHQQEQPPAPMQQQQQQQGQQSSLASNNLDANLDGIERTDMDIFQDLLGEAEDIPTPSKVGTTTHSIEDRKASRPLIQQQQQQQQQQQRVARRRWVHQKEEIKGLLVAVTHLHEALQNMCSREAAAVTAAAAHGVSWPPSPSPAHEAILDFILSTLITPRTVSAVLHAAKKLVCASVMHASNGLGGDSSNLEAPPNDTETQHSMALLLTAFRAVETCLHASNQVCREILEHCLCQPNEDRCFELEQI
jgi:hypothetical protein